MSRLLFLAADLCSGGAERQMVTVACLLKNKGHDVTVLCYDKADFYAAILSKAGIPIVWELASNDYLKRIQKVRRFIRKGKYDAVISFLQTCNFLNDISAVGGKEWKVITGERSAMESFFQTKKGKLFSWFQRYSDAIVCNSNNAKKLWVSHCPNLSDKLRVIYNSVALGEIHSEYIPLKDGKLHILVAATYQYLKNPVGLVEALNLMSDNEKALIKIDWYGRIRMGAGDDTQAYDDTKMLVEKYNLQNVIELHDDTKEIADLMNQADAVMLLSKFEGLPNAICEAMTIGKPIIMTRVSDYNVLVDELNGILCDWDNYESIKKAILFLVHKNKEELLQMGGESKRKAFTLFAAEEVTKRWENLLV